MNWLGRALRRVPFRKYPAQQFTARRPLPAWTRYVPRIEELEPRTTPSNFYSVNFNVPTAVADMGVYVAVYGTLIDAPSATSYTPQGTANSGNAVYLQTLTGGSSAVYYYTPVSSTISLLPLSFGSAVNGIKSAVVDIPLDDGSGNQAFITGGEMVIGVGSSWTTTTLITSATGLPSAPGPIDTSSGPATINPNIFTLNEYAYVKGTPNQFDFDISSVDQVGIPLTVTYSPALGFPANNGLGIIPDRTTFFNLADSYFATAPQFQETIADGAVNGTQYRLVAPGDILTTLETNAINLSAPTTGSGGSLNGAYYYQITALGPTGGESTPSNAPFTGILASGAASLNWTSIPNATGYNIYRGQVTNLQATTQAVSGQQLANGQTSFDLEVTSTVGFPTTGTLAVGDAGVWTAIVSYTGLGTSNGHPAFTGCSVSGNISPSSPQTTDTNTTVQGGGIPQYQQSYLIGNILGASTTYTDNGSNAGSPKRPPTNNYAFDPLNSYFTGALTTFFNQYRNNTFSITSPNGIGGQGAFTGNTTQITATGSDGLPHQYTVLRLNLSNPASTTIAASSDGQTLPHGTINVASTAGFLNGGSLLIQTSAGAERISYTGTTATSFTGCTGGSGTLATGNTVNQHTGPYDFYAPFFSTNTNIPGAPPPPNWLVDPTDSPGAMVFGAGGVFGGGDPTQDVTTILKNIENPIDSAFNRGVATNFALNPNNWANGPVLTSIAPGTTGSLPAGTYYYLVTGVTTNLGNTGSGETVPSLEISQVLSGANDAVTLNWQAQDSTVYQSYNIYRGSSSGGENQLIANVTNTGQTTSYTDLGSGYAPGYPKLNTAPPFVYYAPPSAANNWAPSNVYSAFLHRYNISINGLNYGYAYDDQGNNSTNEQFDPTQVTLTVNINPFSPPAAADQLAIVSSVPPSIITGATIPDVVVVALNSSNAIDTGFNGNVTVALAANPSGDTLSGKTTVKAKNGVATFSGLTLSNVSPGNSFQFTSSGAGTVTSALFAVFADSFPIASPTWTIQAGSFTSSSTAPKATGAVLNEAVLTGMTLGDGSVGATVSLAASGTHYGGVLARGVVDPLNTQPNKSYDFYYGVLYASGSTQLALLGKFIQGNPIVLASASLSGGVTSRDVRLDFSGPTLRLYVDGTLMATANDSSLPAPGAVGIFDAFGGANGSTFSNFTTNALVAPPPSFTDKFNRPDSNSLGNPWLVTQGGFTLNNKKAVAAAGVLSQAVLYGANLTTVDESVTITTQGTAAGLLARWNSATQTGYRVVMTGTTVNVYSVQNGVQTLVTGGMATASGTTGTLRFTVTGTTLQVYFNGTALFGSGLTDSSISGPGTVGLFSGGGSNFGLFSVFGS